MMQQKSFIAFSAAHSFVAGVTAASTRLGALGSFRSEGQRLSELCCAVRACRALEFMMAIMGRLLEKPEMGMSEVVYEQYHATLARWHGFWASSAFNVSSI
jgi:hypothetical protein